MDLPETPADPVAPEHKRPVFAAYTCGTCDIEGRDPEVSPGVVLCWNCGGPAYITARVTRV
ncbi:MAG TPA: hypothetical protein VFQ44_23120 [Streptosporangiaceae bacterium]|nr:hypothetical protein [Streptosporangiaceae bacterium]